MKKTLGQLEQQYEKAQENADIQRKKAVVIKKQIESQRCEMIRKKLNQLNLSAEEFDKFISFLSLDKDKVLGTLENALCPNN